MPRRYRSVKASKALDWYLRNLAGAANDVLGTLPTWAVLEAGNSPDPAGQAFYTMGAHDAYLGLAEDLAKGLRVWLHPDTGEMVGVDIEGDPPPGFSQGSG